MKQPARAENSHENGKSHDEGAKGLGEQSLHEWMILEVAHSWSTSIAIRQFRR